jgi:hypothetical protein
MKFLSYEGANAESRHRFHIRLFGALPLQVAITTTQTSMGLLVVGPDVAQVFAILISIFFSLSS